MLYESSSSLERYPSSCLGDGGHHIQIMDEDGHHALQLIGASVNSSGTVQVVKLTPDQGAALIGASSDTSVVQAGTMVPVSPGKF